MDKKPLTNRKKETHLGEIKVALTALAMTASLAIWNMLSKPEDLQNTASAAQTEAPAATEAPVVMLDLPPMPTLIAPLPEGALTEVQIQPVQGIVTTIQPQAQPVGKILLGGSAPGGTTQQVTRERRSSSNQKPAARTRSSN